MHDINYKFGEQLHEFLFDIEVRALHHENKQLVHIGKLFFHSPTSLHLKLISIAISG